MHAQVAALEATSKSIGADVANYGEMFALAGAEATALHQATNAFLAAYANVLPDGARTGLQTLVKMKSILTDFSNPASLGSASAVLRFKLAAIDYDLSDREMRARSLVERAFLHLDRLIVADEQVRQNWKGAFKNGETRCEALGGAHLLLHGLWGFKAHGTGERTDLVLGTPITGDDVGVVARAAEAMVLTEWKRVPTSRELGPQYAAALSQLRQYGRGVLAGFELQSMRYVVTVASARMATTADVVEGSVTYRHLHIAVDPPTPSKLQ
ncbi:MAG: hypothetical protein H6708_13795 [Kofleriaceae bacterium]|nr:hypothetical protein [Myxococcales bacterium]MCB9561474.1 hypothetical protein [Kofleriaceae bacterium]